MPAAVPEVPDETIGKVNVDQVASELENTVCL